ncbi:MAG: trehalose-phosphatase [Patescibacteria group bacterium]
MKYIFPKLPEIEDKIKSQKYMALLLDFDGTISPIVKKPESACLPEKTRNILKKINEIFPVVIVTGRPLNVIKKKIGVRQFLYAASHGWERNFGVKFRKKIVPKFVLKKLNQFRKIVEKIKEYYPSLIIEKKPYSVTFHYHLMPTGQKKSLKGWLEKFFKIVHKQTSIKVFYDKETIEILPGLNWTKGNIAKLALKYLHKKNSKKFTPIYIGDSLTDEDAFRALKKGITIRVGKNETSAAKWYLRDQSEVNIFLKWLLSLKI